MIFASDSNMQGHYRVGEIDKAYCSGCGSQMIAKSGQVKIPHWAHKGAYSCDTWAEESDWHLGVKSLFDPNECEVVLKNHRADIFTGDTILEIQKSPISIEKVRERNDFYGQYAKRVKWIYHLEDNKKIRVGHLPKTSVMAVWGNLVIVWRSPLKRIFETEYLYIFYNGCYFSIYYYENDYYQSDYQFGSSAVDVFIMWAQEIPEKDFADHVKNTHRPVILGKNDGHYKNYLNLFGG